MEHPINPSAVNETLKVAILSFFESMKHRAEDSRCEAAGATTIPVTRISMLFIHEAGNKESLRDALFVRRIYVLCECIDDGIAVLNRVGSWDDPPDMQQWSKVVHQVSNSDCSTVIPAHSGRLEYVVSTGFESTMMLMEQSLASGSQLFEGTHAASA